MHKVSTIPFKSSIFLKRPYRDCLIYCFDMRANEFFQNIDNKIQFYFVLDKMRDLYDHLIIDSKKEGGLIPLQGEWLITDWLKKYTDQSQLKIISFLDCE